VAPNTAPAGVHDDTEVGIDVGPPTAGLSDDGELVFAAPVAELAVGPRRRRRWPLAVAVALVAAVALGAWWWTSVRVVSSPVPDLAGVAVAVAESAAADAGWDLRRSESFDPTVPAGSVVSQDPTAGTELAEGGVLSVVVSRGPPPVPLPDGVVGVPLAEAEARLVEVGLSTGTVSETYSEEVERGVVLSAEVEPGVEVPFGEQVDLVVSAGPEPRTVPQDLFGRALDEVRSALEALGLPIGSVSEAYSESVQAGSVISVAGAGSRVDRGTPVDVQVSLGPPLVPVPNVTGLSVQQAAEILEDAGLVVTSTTGSPTRPVVSTNPSAGTSVRRGSSVTITTR
jgi:serine/threonine-protein kinase